MAKNKGAPQNLIPQSKRTKEEQKRIATMGGIKSGEVRKEKKLISQIYADMMAKTYNIPYEDGAKKLTGEGLLEETIKRVLAAGGSPAVSMVKEWREATEGSKVAMTVEDRTPFMFVDPPKKVEE